MIIKDELAFAQRRIARFWTKVDQSAGADGCWNWLGACVTGGYGTFRFLGTVKATHRFAYEITHGEILDGAFVLHTCDNRRCVNPSHLYLGNQAQNVRDMVARERHRSGRTWQKLTPDTVREMRLLHRTGQYTIRELALWFGIHEDHANHVIHRKKWRHVL